MKAKNRISANRIVCISGPIGGGKTSLTNILRQAITRSTVKLFIAQPLKDIVFRMFGIAPDFPHAERNKPLPTLAATCPFTEDNQWTPITLWQYIGTDVGRMIDPLIWTRMWSNQVSKILARADAPLIICDDLRFENEFDYIQKTYQPRVLFIYVERSEKQGLSVNRNKRHKSEADLELLRERAHIRIIAPELSGLEACAMDVLVPLLQKD